MNTRDLADAHLGSLGCLERRHRKLRALAMDALRLPVTNDDVDMVALASVIQLDLPATAMRDVKEELVGLLAAGCQLELWASRYDANGQLA